MDLPYDIFENIILFTTKCKIELGELREVSKQWDEYIQLILNSKTFDECKHFQHRIFLEQMDPKRFFKQDGYYSYRYNDTCILQFNLIQTPWLPTTGWFSIDRGDYWILPNRVERDCDSFLIFNKDGLILQDQCHDPNYGYSLYKKHVVKKYRSPKGNFLARFLFQQSEPDYMDLHQMQVDLEGDPLDNKFDFISCA